ncbi:MAG: hypothetical protein CYG60_20545 [Actinobacteria bacterium]|nr:MAG: hypothetical protein CYG60_20545 [Actinomycetota bacterium]
MSTLNYEAAFLVAVSWAVAGAVILLASVRKARTALAWFGAVMFMLASLGAAYALLMLLIDGGSP